jgi:hypothetical protein
MKRFAIPALCIMACLMGFVSTGPAFPPDPVPQVFFDKPFVDGSGGLKIVLSATRSLTGVFQYASFENYAFVLAEKETGRRLSWGAIRLSDEPREGQHVHFTLTLPEATLPGGYGLSVYTVPLADVLASGEIQPQWNFMLTVY